MAEMHTDYKELGRLYKRISEITDYFPPVDTVARHPFRSLYYAAVHIKMMELNGGDIVRELEKLNLKSLLDIEPDVNDQLDFIIGYYDG